MTVSGHLEVIRGLGQGGAEALLVSRAERLARDYGGSFKVLNLAPSQDHFDRVLRDLGVVVEVAPSSSSIRGMAWMARRALGMAKGTVVVAHSPAASIPLKALRALGWRRAILVDVVHSSRYRRPYLVLLRLLNRFGDLAICVSEDVAASETTRGYREKRVVHGGVDDQAMFRWLHEHPDHPATVRHSLGLPATAVVVTFVANMRAAKNHDLVLDVSKCLPGSWTVLLVGDGPERSRLEERVATEGLDNVRLLGRQEHGWQWIAASDAVLHLSHWEGLPVALMEAAALHVPCLTNAFAGASEVAPRAADFVICSDPDPASVASALQSLVDRTASPTERVRAGVAGKSYWGLERYASEMDARISEAVVDRQRSLGQDAS